MMRATDLLGALTYTESGDRLGRIRELRVERDGDRWRLAGLVVSGTGLLERLGALGIKREEPIVGRDAYPWDSVVHLESDRVVIRDGTKRG
jgi:sporulation protein YlmC with PRC-barrel domain